MDRDGRVDGHAERARARRPRRRRGRAGRRDGRLGRRRVGRRRRCWPHAGYEVTAVTGSADAHGYLRALGAAEIAGPRRARRPTGRRLQRGVWAGAVDSVGGTTLATLLAQRARHACVAACGLAGSADLATTVFPFILRGVTLAGIDSNTAPPTLRAAGVGPARRVGRGRRTSTAVDKTVICTRATCRSGPSGSSRATPSAASWSTSGRGDRLALAAPAAPRRRRRHRRRGRDRDGDGVGAAAAWRPTSGSSLLEAERLAFGASGRNAGFLLLGTSSDYASAVDAYGREAARRIWAFTRAGLRAGRRGRCPARRRVPGDGQRDRRRHRRRGRPSAPLARAPGPRTASRPTGSTAAAPIGASSGRTGFPAPCVVPTGGAVDPARLVRALAAESGAAGRRGLARRRRVERRGRRASASPPSAGERSCADRVLVATNALPARRSSRRWPTSSVRCAPRCSRRRPAPPTLRAPVYSHDGLLLPPPAARRPGPGRRRPPPPPRRRGRATATPRRTRSRPTSSATSPVTSPGSPGSRSSAGGRARWGSARTGSRCWARCPGVAGRCATPPGSRATGWATRSASANSPRARSLGESDPALDLFDHARCARCDDRVTCRERGTPARSRR